MKALLSQFITAVFPGIRGRRTHGHVQIAIAIYLFFMVYFILRGEILPALFAFALANHVAAQGASRWTLRSIEKKLDKVMEKYHLEIERDG